ncbi:MAG: hypothetical protein IIU96_05065 [Paludibacteraceae bacterium]|nr:hypothetical protein [Paludibacteraceae bacterium]
MKRQHLILLPLLLSLTGCWTHIWTVAPTAKPATTTQIVYTTQVTTPAPKYVTTTTMAVTSFNTDICFYLDLQAVAAAFAEAKSVKEFEMLLNSSRYMINNLDLNGDGYIDYLRVLETRKGYYHALLIQACIAPGLFQDVATLVAERRANLLYVEVIGDPYLYGYNYIVRPTFVKRPPMWDMFGKPTYTTWNSPYYHGHWPSYYQRTKPMYLSHYQAYVRTYMTNHHYCHVCDYPTHVFYNDYHHMVQPNRRNDYRDQHPDKSFENRVTRQSTSHASNTPIRNAGELRANTQSRVPEATNRDNSTTTTSTTNRPASSTSQPSTRPSATTSQTSTRPATQQTTRPTTTQTTSTRVSNTVTPKEPTTSVETRVNKSGTSRTTVKTINATTSTRSTATSTRTNTTSTSRTTSNTSRTTNNTSTSRTSTNNAPARR